MGAGRGEACGGWMWEVSRAASALQACGDPWALAFRALGLCMERVGCAFGCMLIIGADGGAFSVVAAEGRGSDAIAPLASHKLQGSGWSLEAVAATGAAQLTGDIGRGRPRPRDWVLLHRAAGHRSFVSVPIVAAGACRGCVTLASDAHDAFGAADGRALSMVLSLYAFHALDGQLGRACDALLAMAASHDLAGAIRIWLGFMIKEFGLRGVGLSLLAADSRVAALVTLGESPDGRSTEWDFGASSVGVDKRTLAWRTGLVAAPIHLRDCQAAPPRERDVAMLRVDRGEMGCIMVVPLAEDRLSQIRPAAAGGGEASGRSPGPAAPIGGLAGRPSPRGGGSIESAGSADGRRGEGAPMEPGARAAGRECPGQGRPGRSPRLEGQIIPGNFRMAVDVRGHANAACGEVSPGDVAGGRSGEASPLRYGQVARGGAAPFSSGPAVGKSSVRADDRRPAGSAGGPSPRYPPPVSLVKTMGQPGRSPVGPPSRRNSGGRQASGAGGERHLFPHGHQPFPSPFVSPRSACSPCTSDDTLVLSSGDTSTGDNLLSVSGPGPQWRPGFHSAVSFPPPVPAHDDRHPGAPQAAPLDGCGSPAGASWAAPAPDAPPRQRTISRSPLAGGGRFVTNKGDGVGRFRSGMTAGPSMPQRGAVPGPGPPPAASGGRPTRRGADRGRSGSGTPRSPVPNAVSPASVRPVVPPLALELGQKASRQYGAVYLIGMKPGAFDEALYRAKLEGLTGMFAHKLHLLITSKLKSAFEDLLAKAAKQHNEDVKPDDPLQEKIDSVILKLSRNRRELTAGTLNRLKLLSVLGKGTSGLVLEGEWRNVTTAVKVIRHSTSMLQSQEGENPILKMATEMALTSYVSHPNIVSNYGTHPSVDYKELIKICVVRNPSPRPDSPSTNKHAECVPVASDYPAPYGYLDYASWIVKRLYRAWGFRTSMQDMPSISSRSLKRFPSDRSRVSTPHSCVLMEDNWLTKHLQKCWPLQDLYNSQWALLIMEYCDTGTLEEAICLCKFRTQQNAADDGMPNMEWILLTAYEIASAMEHLHSHGIVHGDLKPSNILLQSGSCPCRGFCAKVADFGTSRIMRENEEYSSSHGTVSYMPPELLLGGKVSPGVDVYSFGIILWEMYHSRKPYSTLYSGESVRRRVVKEGMRPTFGDSAPLKFKELAEHCWAEKLEMRPNFGMIIDDLTAMLADTKQ